MNYATFMSSILYESLKLDINSLETTAGRLICSIKPRWSSKKLTFKQVTGHDESLIYLIHCKETGDEQQGILVRIYATNSEIFINYDEQIRNVMPWIRRGFFPSILAMFNNGYFINNIDGKPMDGKEINNHEMIAQKLADFHAMSSSSSPVQFIDRLMFFIDLLANKNSTLHESSAELTHMYMATDRTRSNLLTSFASAIGLFSNRKLPITFDQLELQLKNVSWIELLNDIRRIRVILDTQWSTLDLPFVLCLNNLKFNNFLLNMKQSLITLRDFDHCSMNYYLFDLVSYFIELANDDYTSKYPSRQIQKHVLRAYVLASKLKMSNLISDQQQPTDEELEYLLHLGDLLVAPIHLYWALWSFLQALLIKPHSSFDYVNYGRRRLAEYYQTKEKFFNSSTHFQRSFLKF